jgi:hypothetical protein
MFEQACGFAFRAVFVLSSFSGCGDDDGGATGSADRTWASLTPDERGKLCDLLSEKLGGYGHKAECPDSDDAAWAAPDRQTCVESVPETCATRVSVMEECIDAVAKDLCHGERIQTTHPACVRSLQCR